MKKFILLAMLAGVLAAPANAANEEGSGGGGFYRACDPVTHILWEHQGDRGWQRVGSC